MVITGLERVLRQPDMLADSGKLGLLYNQASVDRNYDSALQLLHQAFGSRLTTLFGPQHGAGGTEQDNMIETDHGTHGRSGLPLFSLYSDTRRPSREMLANVDTVLVDIQDVGTRVYTFATTVLHLMEAAAETGTSVTILDRPNPINGTDIEGNVLDPDYASFVGPHPIPMRHGMTLGELMRLYNDRYSIGGTLHVVPMEGWQRDLYYEETGLPWVLPSPNMPLVETAVVYPGQVLLEGTNLSEGRGTTRPFEIFGSPYLDPQRIVSRLGDDALRGVVLREVEFRPTFNKWSGEVCRGFQLHVIDRAVFRPFRFSLALIGAILKVHPNDFCWTDPPYEYVYDKLPIDVILGDAQVRKHLENGRSIHDMEADWRPDLASFREIRDRYLLYHD